MRIIKSLIGVALILIGIYFLGQNIVFTTKVSPYWWRDLSATGSVVLTLAGLATLTFFPRETGKAGWVMILLGIALVFVSGRVLLLPTSLWTFFVAFASTLIGLNLLRTGGLRF